MTSVIEVETDLGVVHFSGRDRGLPIVLVLTGTFAVSNFLSALPDRLPQFDVLRAHLPGNHCPRIASTSIGAFAAAYSWALDHRFAGRNVVVMGFSVGALVALALRSPGLRAIVAVEPPLITGEAWPLVRLREEAPPGHEEFLWNVLGIGKDAFESRDYRPTLAGLTTPTTVLLGEEPPPPGQAWVNTQGLVGPAARTALRACPMVRVVDLPGVGHHVVVQANRHLADALQTTLKDVFGSEAAAISMHDGSIRPAP